MGYVKKNSLITEEVFSLLDLLEKNGWESRVVGGAVRDFLLSRPVSDIDIATTATPKEVMDICEKHHIATVPTGVAYGTVLILYGKKSFEVTTLRKDIKTFGRHAEVEFTKSFEIDSKRRDFTINALYMNKHGEISDYHFGIRDIKTKNIRFIGDARERITEDYLRILRYFRFVAVYGEYKCNEEYLEIINSLKSGLALLSGERIFGELLKIFAEPESYKIVPVMKNVLEALFGSRDNSLEICRQLGIFSEMSNVQRLCMLLKFANVEKKYNMPRYISDVISLNPVSKSEIYGKLKQIKKSYRDFYLKYEAVKLYAEGVISKAAAQQLIKEALDFCKSEYVDFNLRAKDLSEYNLTKEELKQVMIATRNYWKKFNASTAECLNFAVDYIDSFRK